MANRLQQLNGDLAQVAGHAQESLVQIKDGRRGGGAGVIVRSDGLILTNAHVLSRRKAQITLNDGQKLPGRLLAYDKHNDLALLRVDVEGTDLPTMPFGNSQQIKAGEWVTALGHPWGVKGAATGGVVVTGGPHLPEMPTRGRDMLAVSLHLRPGHSGGPLVDAQGQLIGINTMMAGPDVGLVVPVHVIKAFMREALEKIGEVMDDPQII